MSKIEELKEALEAATPGEWDIIPPGNQDDSGDTRIFGAVVVAPHRVICAEGRSHREAKANTRFIALAHNLMPQLLKAMELVGIIARMKTDCEIQEQTDFDDCMSGDDAAETLSSLIECARQVEGKLK